MILRTHWSSFDILLQDPCYAAIQSSPRGSFMPSRKANVPARLPILSKVPQTQTSAMSAFRPYDGQDAWSSAPFVKVHSYRNPVALFSSSSSLHKAVFFHHLVIGCFLRCSLCSFSLPFPFLSPDVVQHVSDTHNL